MSLPYILICLFTLVSFSGHAMPIIEPDTIPEATLDTLINIREVEIEAKYMERRDDGVLEVLVYGNPLAKGQQIDKFLSYLPDIIVQDDEVNVGSSKSVVYELDGRIITWDEFKSLPLEMVSRLEVVRHGGIKYGGNDSAVLRVTLRRVPGLLGSFRYDHAIYPYGTYLMSPHNTMLLRDGSHTLYSNLSFFHNDNIWKHNRTDYYEDHTEEIQRSTFNRHNRLNEALSYQYEWNEGTRLQVYGALSFSHLNTGAQSQGLSYLKTLKKEKYTGYSAGAKFFHTFGGVSETRRHELEMTLNYSGRDIAQNYNYASIAANTAKSRELQNNLDFDMFTRFSLSDNQRLAFRFNCYGGPKHYRYAGITDPVLTALNRQDYTESNFSQSLSANYNATLGDFYIDANTGYYHIPFKITDHQNPSGSYKRSSGGFLSTLFVRWNMNRQRGRALELSLLQSFSIPNYGYFTPVVSYVTPSFYNTGNKRLKDEKQNNLKLTYHINDKTNLSATVRYQRKLVQVMMHEDPDQPGVHYTRLENIGHSWVYNLSCSRSGYAIPKVWYMNHSLMLQYTYQNMSTKQLYAPFATLYSNHNWRLSNTLQLMLSIAAIPRMKTINGEAEGTVNISPGASIALFQNSLFINLDAHNLFGNLRKMTYYGDGFRYSSTHAVHPDVFTLVVRWNFHAGRKIQQTRLTELDASGSGMTIPWM